jgi:hypothetical protein
MIMITGTVIVRSVTVTVTVTVGLLVAAAAALRVRLRQARHGPSLSHGEHYTPRPPPGCTVTPGGGGPMTRDLIVAVMMARRGRAAPGPGSLQDDSRPGTPARPGVTGAGAGPGSESLAVPRRLGAAPGRSESAGAGPRPGVGQLEREFRVLAAAEPQPGFLSLRLVIQTSATGNSGLNFKPPEWYFKPEFRVN